MSIKHEFQTKQIVIKTNQTSFLRGHRSVHHNMKLLNRDKHII